MKSESKKVVKLTFGNNINHIYSIKHSKKNNIVYACGSNTQILGLNATALDQIGNKYLTY